MRKAVLLLAGLSLLAIIFGTIYVVTQQSLRLSANDPQIQLAEDMAAQLDRGSDPHTVAGAPIDIARSLATFSVIYDKSGKAVAGSGQLNGQLPQVPMGVLKAADSKDYSFVTWQPVSSLRIAAVSVAADNYYVLSGRSLQEVEKREHTVLWLAVSGWLASVVLVGTAYALYKSELLQRQ